MIYSNIVSYIKSNIGEMKHRHKYKKSGSRYSRAKLIGEYLSLVFLFHYLKRYANIEGE